MIQFNLLPDVKLEYLRAKRMKRVVVVLSSLTVGVVLVFLGGLFTTVNIVQGRHIANLESDITAVAGSIKQIDDIDRMLTVQGQLFSIDELHEGKPVVSRLFDFIETFVPVGVSINSLDVNIANQAIEISGATESITEVNRFVDTIKFTDYVIVEDGSTDLELAIEDDDSESGRAFSSVVLSSFSRDDDSANFSIDMTFEPLIFESQNEVALFVKRLITTRSELNRPEALFAAPKNDNNQDNGSGGQNED